MFIASSSDDVNQNGIYGIRCYNNGCTQEVVVDSFIPSTSSGELAMTGSNKNELWVVILEKAWAKLHGSYIRI